jgi:hypothetical protein
LFEIFKNLENDSDFDGSAHGFFKVSGPFGRIDRGARGPVELLGTARRRIDEYKRQSQALTARDQYETSKSG